MATEWFDQRRKPLRQDRPHSRTEASDCALGSTARDISGSNPSRSTMQSRQPPAARGVDAARCHRRRQRCLCPRRADSSGRHRRLRRDLRRARALRFHRRESGVSGARNRGACGDGRGDAPRTGAGRPRPRRRAGDAAARFLGAAPATPISHSRRPSRPVGARRLSRRGWQSAYAPSAARRSCSKAR